MARDPNPAEDVVLLLASGEAPREIRFFAAQGLLPLDRENRVRALLEVLDDPDPDVSAAAARTLRATPPDELTRFLESGATEEELDAIARHSDDPFVLERVIRDRQVDDRTLEMLARTVTGAPQEALVVNQVRLIRQPALIDALFENPQLTADARRRLNEIREEFFDKQRRRVEQQRESEAAAEAAAEAALEEDAEEELEAEPAEPVAEGEEGVDFESSLTTGAVYRRIAVMTVSEKIKLAYSGGKEERRILMADANRLVGLAVLKSRGLTINEVESYCSMRHLDTELFRKIAENREWIRKPAIVVALVKNPKVPLPVTLPLIKYLPIRELRVVARDPNLAEGLRISARKLLTEKRR